MEFVFSGYHYGTGYYLEQTTKNTKLKTEMTYETKEHQQQYLGAILAAFSVFGPIIRFAEQEAIFFEIPVREWNVTSGTSANYEDLAQGVECFVG